jgi:NAD-dependent deacetylase
MKRIVVFTGAGISAESGLRTFRDSDGLWEQHRIEDVATPQAWQRNPEQVTRFYNERRKQVAAAQPNQAHRALVLLQEKFKVHIVTQNIDDLHERAGSENILHLHGEIMKVRSEVDASLVYSVSNLELSANQTNDLGHRLRPHIVWFGEMVPKMDAAIFLAQQADIFIVVGSSLEVYPAAGLIDYVPQHAVKYLVDPNAKSLNHIVNLITINQKAGIGVPHLVNQILSDHV